MHFAPEVAAQNLEPNWPGFRSRPSFGNSAKAANGGFEVEEVSLPAN